MEMKSLPLPVVTDRSPYTITMLTPIMLGKSPLVLSVRVPFCSVLPTVSKARSTTAASPTVLFVPMVIVRFRPTVTLSTSRFRILVAAMPNFVNSAEVVLAGMLMIRSRPTVTGSAGSPMVRKESTPWSCTFRSRSELAGNVCE